MRPALAAGWGLRPGPWRVLRGGDTARRAAGTPAALSAAAPAAAAAVPAAAATRRPRAAAASPARKFARDVLSLYKYKLSTWAAISTLPGFVMYAPPGDLAGLTTFCALAGGAFLTSGGANCLNQVMEADLDRQMARTRNRPIPRGSVSREAAAAVGVGGVALGCGVLACAVNVPTAVIGGVTAAAYLGVYTVLKTRTPYNTHAGAVVGALPALMGVAAAGGAIFSPDALTLFAIQFLWQLPHFYGLAWRFREDYLRAGFKSFPLADVTGRGTAALMRPYIFAAGALPVAVVAAGLASPMYLVDGGAANVALAAVFARFARAPTARAARAFFAVSLWHLMALLFCFVLHSRVTHGPAAAAEAAAAGAGAALDAAADAAAASAAAASAAAASAAVAFDAASGLGGILRATEVDIGESNGGALFAEREGGAWGSGERAGGCGGGVALGAANRAAGGGRGAAGGAVDAGRVAREVDGRVARGAAPGAALGAAPGAFVSRLRQSLERACLHRAFESERSPPPVGFYHFFSFFAHPSLCAYKAAEGLFDPCYRVVTWRRPGRGERG